MITPKADKNFRIYDTGEFECVELIEGNGFKLNSDGTICCPEFIEDSELKLAPTFISFSSFIEK